MKAKAIYLCMLSWLLSHTAMVASATPQISGPDASQIVFLKQNSKPKYFASNHTGLCGELYTALIAHLENMGFTSYIDPENYPIKRILKMLEHGSANVFCGAGRNAQREARFIYSKIPVYTVANVVAARANDDFVPASMNDLVKKQAIVGALYGTSSSAWLKGHEGVRVNDKFHDLDTALEALANHAELRFFYYHDLGLNYLTEASGLPLKVLPTRFRSTEQWLIYSPETNEASQQALNDSLKAIRDTGELSAIQKKYLLADTNDL